MKNTGICPKCGSAEIIRIEGQARAYGAGNNIPVGMTIFSYIKVPRYVCMDCGFSEEWIDEKDLPVLWEKFR
ncbi:MAG: hypothetical protein IKG46_14805 [Solobacterium sp.]|nr:hypothetical protein [Solobacterium sp.]